MPDEFIPEMSKEAYYDMWQVEKRQCRIEWQRRRQAEAALEKKNKAYDRLLFICDWFDDCYPADYETAWIASGKRYG